VSASKLIRDLIQLLVNNVMRTLFPSLHLTFFDVAIDQVIYIYIYMYDTCVYVYL